jgi:sugar/nucleoside kinase (ribokinase family)
MTPDVLIVGHVTKDLVDEGWRAGGSVLYAAAQCQRLGLQVAAVTVCSGDLDPASLAPEVSWQVINDETSTTFENRYAEGQRSQRVLAQARQIEIDDIPEEWQGAPVVLLMPVFRDVDEAILASFACSATLSGVSVQGWLRELDITTVRIPDETPSGRRWQGTDAVFLSEEDLAEPESAEAWTAYVPTVVLTRGERGTTVWSNGVRVDLPAIEVDAVDATGAGDVFAAAFMVRLHENGDTVDAARFATAAAAFAVQGRGIEAIGGREAIESLMRTMEAV